MHRLGRPTGPPRHVGRNKRSALRRIVSKHVAEVAPSIRHPPFRRERRNARSLSSGRPTGSGLWPARWQAPAGPGGLLRPTVIHPGYAGRC